MAFRARPSMVLMGGWSALEDVDEVDPDTGRTTHKRFNPHTEKLPPIENYEIETLLKAGVSLQQTRTKVLAPNVTGLVDSLASLSDEEFQDTMEKNTK